MSEVREITNLAEWLAWRRHDMTASRVAALFDAHPYMSLNDLMGDMRGQSVRGDTPSMRAGRLLEACFPQAIAEIKPKWQITKATTYHRLADRRFGATPDFWANDDGLIQAKTVGPIEWERWQGRPPLGYSLQTLGELIVTGRRWAALAVMVRSPTLPLYLFDVPRHEAAEQRILDGVAAFWSRVDKGEMPVATPPDELEKLLDDGSHRDLSGDGYLPAALERHEVLSKIRRDTVDSLKTIEYEIKQRMGQASTAWLPGWAISWRAQHTREHTVAAHDKRVLRIKRTEE